MNAPSRSILSVRIVPIALALLGFSTAAKAQIATGDFSAVYLGAGNFDTQVGLTTKKEYLYAINLGNTPSVTVNGVTFTGVGGANPNVAGQFSLSGTNNVFASGAPNPGGQLGLLMTDFIYGAALTPEVVTINGLSVGEAYVVTFYNMSWDPEATGRRQTMVGSSRVDLQACKLEYSIVSPK